MTETIVDLAALRTAFKPEEIGKLPRVTCRRCSERGVDCDKHAKAECAVCGNWLGKHIHLDYVGHADVTLRLLEVDPEWDWQPKATDPDPDLLKAAVASGNAEIVQAVIGNAPPKFERDRSGSPVGLWIKLTVGGVTRLGVGSCPSNQNDAEKVLIGDALRNAAMRFGVAAALWAKGDRENPTAENATASAGKASRRGGTQSAADAFENAAPAAPRQNGSNRQQQGQVSRPAQQEAVQQPSADIDDEAVQDWAAKIDEITTAEDADRSDAELRDVFKSGRMNPTTANVIRVAIRARRQTVAQREMAVAQ